MKKSLIVLPVMLLLLGACVGPNPGSSSEPNPSSSEPTPSSSEPTPSSSEPTPSSSEEPTSSSEPVVDVQTIAQVRALSAEGAVTIEGNVVAKNEKGFILADATGFILVFLGSAPTQGIGDFVRVAGTTSMYQGARQITNNPLPTITAGEGTNPHAGLGTAAQMTKAQWDAFDMASNVPTYITGVATVFASGTYYNFHFAGIGETGAASLPGSIAYASTELNFAVAANVDKAYTFTALLIGSSVSGGVVVRQNILVTSFAPVQSGGESSSEPTPSSSESTSEPGSSSSQNQELALLATYDLSDQVRTPYINGSVKYENGAFATFLKTKIVAGGTEKLVSSSGETNVYAAEQSGGTTGPQFNGIKVGSSSGSGAAFTLTFEAGTQIGKVVIGGAGWASPNTDTVAINGGAAVTPTQGGTAATVEAITIELATASNVISVVTTKRLVINYIAIYATLVA